MQPIELSKADLFLILFLIDLQKARMSQGLNSNAEVTAQRLDALRVQLFDAYGRA
jgi:hypothetical protein